MFKIVAVNIVLVICLRKHSNLMENMIFNLWLNYLFFNYDTCSTFEREISLSIGTRVDHYGTKALKMY